MDESTEPILGFLSYAHVNDRDGGIRRFHEVLQDELQQCSGASYEIFIDENIGIGSSWNDHIKDRLKSSRFLVVMVSPAFLASAECKKEYDYFCEVASEHAWVFPILYLSCALLTGNPFYTELSRLQYQDFTRFRFEESDKAYRHAVSVIAQKIVKQLHSSEMQNRDGDATKEAPLGPAVPHEPEPLRPQVYQAQPVVPTPAPATPPAKASTQGRVRWSPTRATWIGGGLSVLALIAIWQTIDTSICGGYVAGMVRIPAGAFHRGPEDTAVPRAFHAYPDISFPPFPPGNLSDSLAHSCFIDVNDVTNAQYSQFLNAERQHGDHDPWAAPGQPKGYVHAAVSLTLQSYGGANQPVCGVSWFDAYAYAKWAGKRLPTNAEWEKAARGENGNMYPWGNVYDTAKCNSKESDTTASVAVGSYPSGASPYGVMDMAGNVDQWTNDSVLPDGKTVLHCFRGGNCSENCQVASLEFMKSIDAPSDRPQYTGFRCAEDADEGSAPTGMVLIPAGKFVSGDSDPSSISRLILDESAKGVGLPHADFQELVRETPKQVNLTDPYFIDRHKVTVAEYKDFLNDIAAHPEKRRLIAAPGADPNEDFTPDSTVWDDDKFNDPDLPVVGVDWYSAYAYAHWKGEDLPTEEEWERAARGRNGLDYPWGDTFTDKACNGQESGSTSLEEWSEPGTPISPDGVYEMAGNAWEWTADAITLDKVKQYRIRGGDYLHTSRIYALTYVGASLKPDYRPAKQTDNDTPFYVGFRCVRRNVRRSIAQAVLDQLHG